MTPDLSIRIANPSDVDAITKLVNLAFRVERFFVDGDRVNAPEVRERFSTGQFFLAELGDPDDQGHHLIGSVYVEKRGERCFIGLLAVDPSHQGNGIGKRLMAAAEDHGRAKGCRTVELQVVNLREELPSFYQRLGYVQIGVAPFPTDVVTKIDCHFVNMEKTL
jgi:GNAT superfamily N-acetyltransferase